MMTSSPDELISDNAESAVSIDHLRVIRGKRPALHDFSVNIARGT
ncbi:MAG: ABC transporter ATP-binding protein, partial [Mycobacterium sp.]